MRGNQIYKELQNAVNSAANAHNKEREVYNTMHSNLKSLQAKSDSLMEGLSRAIMDLTSKDLKGLDSASLPMMKRFLGLSNERQAKIEELNLFINNETEQFNDISSKLKNLDDNFVHVNQALHEENKAVESSLFSVDENKFYWDNAEKAYQAHKRVVTENAKAREEIAHRFESIGNNPFFLYLNEISWNTENYNRFWFSKILDGILAKKISYVENKKIYDNLKSMEPYLNERLKEAEINVEVASKARDGFIKDAVSKNELSVQLNSKLAEMKILSSNLRVQKERIGKSLKKGKDDLSLYLTRSDNLSISGLELLKSLFSKDFALVENIVANSKTTKDDQLLNEFSNISEQIFALTKDLKKRAKKVEELKANYDKQKLFADSFRSKGYHDSDYRFSRVNQSNVMDTIVTVATIDALFRSFGTPTDTSYSSSSSSSSHHQSGGGGGFGGFGGGGFGGGGIGGGGFSTGGGF